MNPAGFQREAGIFPKNLVGNWAEALVATWNGQMEQVSTWLPLCGLSPCDDPNVNFIWGTVRDEAKEEACLERHCRKMKSESAQAK